LKRRCERCDYEIDAKYLLKQDSFNVIICPNCGRTLVAMEVGKVLCAFVFIIVFVLFLIFPLSYLWKVIVECAWMWGYKEILPAFIYRYEEVKDDVDL